MNLYTGLFTKEYKGVFVSSYCRSDEADILCLQSLAVEVCTYEGAFHDSTLGKPVSI